METSHSLPDDAGGREALDKPSPLHAAHCPVEDWLGFLGHRWNAVILWHLIGGEKRQSELIARLPGITAKVLSERLGGLVRRDLVRRSEVSRFPRAVTYELTSRGRHLTRILDQIEIWSRQL